MSVISSITATNISTTGTTINYTLGSSVTSDIYLYKFISRIDVPTPLTAIGDTVVLVQTVVSGTPSGNYSITDTNLSSNTAYAYAFYNGNGSGTAIPYNPFVKLKTYVDVNYVNANALTATSTEISNTLSNTLSSQTTCYLYRYSSITSIPTAPIILDTSIGTYLTSFNIAQGTNVSPTTTLVSYTDTTLSNTSYTYAYYNGQSNGTSTILSNTSVVAQSDSTITFATVDTSSISISIITNTLARLNYTIRNNLPNQNTDTYLFRFAGSSAPISDPTSGVQIGSAITTYGDGGVGISSTPINATGLSANTQYTFAFFNGNTSSATILRNNTRAVQSVTFSTTNVLNTSLTASSITSVSATINYTLSNTPSIIGTTVYLYRFTGNSAPTTLSGGTSRRSVVLTANHSATSSNFFDTGLSINNSYTYAFYDGNSNGTSVLLMNYSETALTTTIYTQDLLPPVTYDVYVSTYKNTAITIHLEATDPQTSALSYTYEAPNKGILTGSGPDVLYTPTSTGADSFTYYATNTYTLSSTPSTVYIDINHSNPPCFKEGSRILCFNPQEEKEEYIPIETIRKGTLVKTIKHGYVKVDMIGKSTIYNSGDSERITNRLFVCAQDQYPELFEELVLTGYHAILVDRFKDVEERARTRELLKYNYMTDGKYRLPACIDARAKPYEIEGEFTIWHVALENEDYFMNYGIYANGLIVESCSKRYLKELSKMTLIE